MRVTFDRQVNAAYIYLTDAVLDSGRDSIPLEVPEGTPAMVIMDWKDGKIVGLEVLGATSLLHPDLLALADSSQSCVGGKSGCVPPITDH